MESLDNQDVYGFVEEEEQITKKSQRERQNMLKKTELQRKTMLR